MLDNGNVLVGNFCSKIHRFAWLSAPRVNEWISNESRNIHTHAR